MAVPTFLTAEWRKLAIANYSVEPGLLRDFIPAGTELDLWQNTCYISLVGFMFLNTRLKGFSVPCHANFEEVNLRFYVKHKREGNWKRGVVFIKEIVPRPALSLVANRIYKENYQTMPMKHSWNTTQDSLDVAYSWKKRSWNNFSVSTNPDPVLIEVGSEEEFITEHYWGYTKINRSITSEYEVQHPRWMAYHVKNYSIDVNFGDVYGPQFAFLSEQVPKSVMLAEGSKITVKAGNRIVTNLP
jgi:hypothetical protein